MYKNKISCGILQWKNCENRCSFAEVMTKLDRLRWFSQRRSPTPHFGAPRGAMTPKFEFCRDVCRMHLPPTCHRPVFTRSEVILLTNTHTHKQTNKQMPLKTSNTLCYASTLDKNKVAVFWNAVYMQTTNSQIILHYWCGYTNCGYVINVSLACKNVKTNHVICNIE